MVKKSILQRVFCITAFLVASQATAKTADIESVRVWSGPDHTRAVFDLSAQADYKLFQLDNPPRVVIDVDAGRLKSNLDLPKNRDIKGIRYSENKERVRLVLDLNKDFKPKSFLLKPTGKYGHRLVVDLNHQQEQPHKTIEQIVSENRDVLIAIDAGHGGEDPGAIGASGTYEKEVTLKIARALEKKINAQKGMKAMVIRDGDYYIKLRDRFKKARDHRADLFVSIHADAFHSSEVNGASVYVLSQRGASSEAAKWLADSENQADSIGGVKIEDKRDMLSQVLYDLSQNAAMEESHKAGQAVYSALKNKVKLHGRGFGQAAFIVLKSPDVPSMLIETGYISNPDDEKNLKSPAHIDKLTTQITSGIQNYFYQSPPPRTWIATQSKAKKHVVQSGDTLSAIASRNGTSIDTIKSINNKNNNSVMVGEVLFLPQ
ncbi:N-acetylmuramoyl-L-alanine amidase [Marinicella pacifica]|uniref:N-acetylmuramoyl-L-alanine amidase n=1 Tax=Marinicella pacifica TaxID=1171543 RepID=UPI00166D2646|nr:N-acetylmuramoyl-L-alanine amidase [Marinicella pacifica]